MMTVADYITNFLIQKRVQHVFGFQGGAVLKILDSMIQSGKIEYIQNYHEQASSFSADAYSRITHNIGVAIATSGPGATNLISGIANAYFDSIPCLFITGQDYSNNIQKPDSVRQNGFQDLDVVSMVKPITKYATMITEPEKIRYELEKAFYLAKSGRPGSVLLDIPVDIQFAEIDEAQLEGFIPEDIAYEVDKIFEILPLLKLAKRPLILVGGGVQNSDSEKLLKELIDQTNIPVTTTLNGIDSFKQPVGFSGLYGQTHANLAVYNADLLIVVGSRLGIQQISKNPENYIKNAKVVHIDIDHSELGRKIEPDLSIYCDVKLFLEKLVELVSKENLPSLLEWKEYITNWEENYARNVELNKESLDPVKFVRELSALFEDETIITSDVGQNQMWVAQGINLAQKQRLLNSSGFGSMGYSLPAAIGASYARPNAQIISFSGDGGFQMNMQELLLIAKRNLNIKAIVFNNNTLGLMRDVQRKYFDKRFYGANINDFECVNLELLAKTYGINYFKVLENSLELTQILKSKEPYIVEVCIPMDTLLLNRFNETDIYEENLIND